MTILKETDSAVTIEIDGVENGKFEIVVVFVTKCQALVSNDQASSSERVTISLPMMLCLVPCTWR